MIDIFGYFLGFSLLAIGLSKKFGWINACYLSAGIALLLVFTT